MVIVLTKFNVRVLYQSVITLKLTLNLLNSINFKWAVKMHLMSADTSYEFINHVFSK